MVGICEVQRLGLIPYMKAWEYQNRLAGAIAQENRLPVLLLLEHPHTYTFGRRGHAENLVWDVAELARRGVEVHWVDRGGDVTYHGPGQLVGYPLLPLASVSSASAVEQSGSPRIPRADYVGYVRKLEQVLILALSWLGVSSNQLEGLTGVWVQSGAPFGDPGSPPALRQAPAKIAAIGVKVDAHGISRHGFALNVAPDMSYWNGIIACGLKDTPVASLADFLDPAPAMEQVMDRIAEAFGTVFGYKMVEAASE